MRKQKRWRYYCDYCKKVSGQKPAMERHEKSCTNRADRLCGVCGANGVSGQAMGFLRSINTTLDEYLDKKKNEEKVVKLRDIVDGCPACMLAAVRQSNTGEVDLDYKTEHSRYWKERNANEE